VSAAGALSTERPEQGVPSSVDAGGSGQGAKGVNATVASFAVRASCLSFLLWLRDN